MNYKNIAKEIEILEKEYKVLFKKFKNHNLINSKVNKYLKTDKESFKTLW